MFGNRRMPNGMSEEAQSRGHAVWEGAPCKGALYPISRCAFREEDRTKIEEELIQAPAGWVNNGRNHLFLKICH